MYDEDRERALELYNSIFDEAGDENAVLQLFVSATRQAVNLARAYDAKERRQQMAAGYLAEEPAFVRTIEDLREQAEAMGLSVTHVDDNQFSLFDEPDAAEAVFQDLEASALPTEEEEEEPDTPPMELPVSESLFPDEDPSADPLPPAPEPVPQAEEAPAVPAEEPAREAEPGSDSVDAFLTDFSLPPEASGAEPREKQATELPPLFQLDGRDEDSPASGRSEPRGEKSGRYQETFIQELPPLTKKKPRIALLILFILLAVPLTLACVCLLLIPAALTLALAAAALSSGFWGVAAAFTGFSVFADILVVFGLALIVIALGLLFLWFFIRLLFSTIPGLIRGVCALGRSWCYKEVPV